VPTRRLLLTHPLRAVAILFAGMAALFAACAPFVPIDPVRFLGGGLAYCLLLSLFAVGLVLACPGRLLHWWVLFGTVPWLGAISFWLSLRSLSAETNFRMLSGAARGLSALLLIYLAVGSVVSGSGWIQYIRWHRSASHAEPGDAPDRGGS
jgi:hypothetical protein